MDLSQVLILILRNQMRILRVIISKDEKPEIVLKAANDIIDETNNMIEAIEK